jgi:NAD(P)-dependent dehydrogenase (short-subunit alcohol dehydrogenase family)
MTQQPAPGLAASFDLRGRSAFVTGAASGLGLAFTEALAEAGATVTLADRDAAGLERAVAGLREHGRCVAGRVLDVGDFAALRQAIDDTAVAHGSLDIVFANAGISGGASIAVPEGRIEAISLATWDEVLRINLTSVFATMQAAAAHMKRQRSGRIIVTASVAGLRASAIAGYPYSATKAALIQLVKLAAIELAPFNVMVNAIAPGPFRTNIGGGRMARDPEAVARMAQTVPLGRVADPSEIKGLALLLASPAASFLTGTVIPIDGGRSAG